VWAAAWLVLGTTGLLPGGVAAAVLFAAFMGVFGLGETMLQPTIPALVNDLAPDHSRGRYNAASSAAFQAAAVTGPPVAGFLIAHELDQVYVGVLVAGSLLLAALALRLERTVPPEVNGVHSPRVETRA
ncbi:MAG TPA: MFS transporter, partial [Nocardioides sp.]